MNHKLSEKQYCAAVLKLWQENIRATDTETPLGGGCLGQLYRRGFTPQQAGIVAVLVQSIPWPAAIRLVEQASHRSRPV